MNSTSIAVESGAGRFALPGVGSGASWTIAASVSAALSQWLLLMLTAKLGSPEMVGHLALSLAVVAPIQILTDLALRPALATDAGREFHFRDYLRLRAAMTAVCLTAVLVAAVLRGGPAAPIIIVIGLQKAAESVSDLFYGLFQREEKLEWMGHSVVLRSALASMAFAGVMIGHGGLFAACLAGLIVRIGVLVLHDVPRGAELSHWRSEASVSGGRRSLKLLIMSGPLALSVFMMSLAVNIPRYFVETRMGVAALGLFAALVYLFQAGAMSIDALGQASCARLSRFYLARNSRAFRRLTWKLVGLAGAGSGAAIAVAVLGGPTLLRLLYSPAFAGTTRPFIWLSVCTLPWYCSSVLGYVIIASRRMTALFQCQIVSFSSTLVASYFWIGQGGGLSRACGVVFITYSALLVMYTLVLWREQEVEAS